MYIHKSDMYICCHEHQLEGAHRLRCIRSAAAEKCEMNSLIFVTLSNFVRKDCGTIFPSYTRTHLIARVSKTFQDVPLSGEAHRW